MARPIIAGFVAAAIAALPFVLLLTWNLNRGGEDPYDPAAAIQMAILAGLVGVAIGAFVMHRRLRSRGW